RHLLLLLKGVFLPDFLISEKRKGLPPSAYTSADNDRPYSNLSYSLVSKLSEKILNPAGVIQRDPPCAGFQLAPTGSPLSVRFLHNGKNAFPGILPGLPVIRPRPFPDIQIRDGHLHQIRGKSASGSLASIDSFPRLIVYRIPRILIRALSGIGKHFERSFLGLFVCPGLPDPKPSAVLRLRCPSSSHSRLNIFPEPVHGIAQAKPLPQMLRVPVVGGNPPAVPFPVADDNAVRGRIQIVLLTQVCK